MGIGSGLLRTVRTLRAARRRTWSGEARTWIEARPLHDDEVPAFVAALQARLGALPGVDWVRFNAALGRVVVGRGGDAGTPADLAEAVEAAEADAGAGRRAFAADPRALPCDTATDQRLLVEMGADVVALLAGLVLRADEATPGEIDAAALLRTIEEVPWIRRVIDDWLGAASADLVLGLASAASAASMHGVTGPVADLAYRALRLSSVRAVRAVWQAREPELGGHPDAHPSAREDLATRAAPLRDGPIETYANGAVLAALGGFGIGVASTRRFESAAGALFGGVPKPAHLGRKAFAAALAENLAGRGLLVLDGKALRRLDRLDTVVVDGSLLAPVGGEIVDVRPLTPGVAGTARSRVLRLFDPSDPFAVRRDGAWLLGPLSRLEITLAPDLAGPLRAAAAPGGRLLGLVHRGALQAVVAVRPELEPSAETLVGVVRRRGLRLVVTADDPSPVSWLRPERVLTSGRACASGLRALQAEGRGLLVVGAAGYEALSFADVALGLPMPGEPTPWNAHVLARQGLFDAALLVEAVEAARRCASQSVQIATVEAVAGLAVSLQGASGRTSSRVLTVSNLASMLAMANGVRIARALAPPPRVGLRDHTPWHALDADVLLARLGSQREGLTDAEALARRTPPVEPPSDLEQLQRVLAEELDNPLAPVLATGAALSALTGSTTDALMVGGVLGLNGLIAATQRVRAERALAELERHEARRVRTRRGRAWTPTLPEHLVRGDVIRLEAGEIVPADARVLVARAVEVDESALTGESVPVAKGSAPSFSPHAADRSSMLFAGTTLAAGEVEAVVVAVGEATEAAAAATRVSSPPKGGVEARLEALTGFTAPIAALAGLAVLAAGLARRSPPSELVGSAVSLSVAAVPEGLPLLAMLAQLATARRLAARGALARNPRALEALGRVDVLCADKTGTLTEGRLRLVRVAEAHRDAAPDALDGALRDVLALAAVATPPLPPVGTLPHPTDQAVAEGAAAAGCDTSSWERLDVLPFEPKRGWHAALARAGRTRRLVVKGAPETVLPRCDRARTAGRVDRLDADARARLVDRAAGLAAQGLRVLVVAERGTRKDTLSVVDVDRLVFRGFVALADPVRPSAREALDDLRKAGVRVVMITGDHPRTAAAIARQLGLRDTSVVTGAELEVTDEDHLDALLPDVDVFARVTPQHKVRLVRALQRTGRVVAMTGDGANDAPAIRQADIGIALGERATTAARHAASLVVADGRVETIVGALLEGRALWAAVRDAVGLLVGANLGEVLFTLAGGLAVGKAPLNARQLLLVNLLTDALPALALAVRPPGLRAPEVLARAGPEASLGGDLDRDIAWRAAVTAASAGTAWTVARWTLPPRQADTVGLAALVGTQLGQTMLLAGESRDVRLTAAGSAAALLAIVQTPPLARFFGSTPLGPLGLVQAVVGAGAGTVAAAVLPPVVERAAARARGVWDGEALAESEIVRLFTESRTLRRLRDRGARLRAASRAEPGEEP